MYMCMDFEQGHNTVMYGVYYNSPVYIRHTVLTNSFYSRS